VIDPDRAAVEAVKSGNTEAFRDLVDRHKGRVFAILLSLTGDEDLAAELSQEAFVKAFSGLSNFRQASSFGTWLVQIAIHRARDHRRRMRRARDWQVISLDDLRERRHDFEPMDTRRSADPGIAVESNEETSLVREAMAQLPPEYREVLVLKHFEGWSYEEIAASTGDTIGTLKVRAHRARRFLKEHLATLGWDADADGTTRRSRGRRSMGGKETNDG
jgi:RNA polymerase sigma-70 factor (ECF subfamily)